MQIESNSKTVIQLKAALREKEMQHIILMSHLGLALYKEDDVKKQYSSKFANLFEKIADNAVEMATIEADIEELTKPRVEENIKQPEPVNAAPTVGIKEEERTVQCAQCGAMLRETDTFCFSCGSHVGAVAVKISSSEKETVVSEGAQLIEQAKKERKERAEQARKEREEQERKAKEEQERREQEERQRKEQEEQAKKKEAKEKKNQRSNAGKEDSAAKKPTGKLRINPEKVKKAKDFVKNMTKSATEQEENNESATTSNKEQPTTTNTNDNSKQSGKYYVPSDDSSKKNNTKSKRSSSSKTNKSNSRTSKAQGIFETPDDSNSEEDARIADVFNDIVEKRKNQKGSWSESLATLETELDPFASLEKKRKRSFKEDMQNMSEETLTKSRQTRKVNDIRGKKKEENKCPECGEPLSSTARFCPMCGYEV